MVSIIAIQAGNLDAKMIGESGEPVPQWSASSLPLVTKPISIKPTQRLSRKIGPFSFSALPRERKPLRFPECSGFLSFLEFLFIPALSASNTGQLSFNTDGG
jgi:hypothetical protein